MRSRIFLVVVVLLVVLILFPWFAGASASVEVEARVALAVRVTGAEHPGKLPGESNTGEWAVHDSAFVNIPERVVYGGR